MSTSGFGVAGHKNSYSSGVRCGNWVEDKFGIDLASQENATQFKATSEHQDHYVLHDVGIGNQGMENLHASIRMSGLSYNLLINHREDGKIHQSLPSQGRYETTYVKTHKVPKDVELSNDERISLARLRLLRADQEKARNPYWSSTKFNMIAPYKAQAAAKIGKQEISKYASNMSFSKSFFVGQHLRS